MYGLHTGTLADYVNTYCNAGVFGKMNITSRLLAFQAQAFWERGYQGIIGVATHPDTVKRSEARHILNDYDIIVAKIEYKSWYYNPNDEENNLNHSNSINNYHLKANRYNPNQAKFHQIAFSGEKINEQIDKKYSRPFKNIKTPSYCVVIYEIFQL